MPQKLLSLLFWLTLPPFAILLAFQFQAGIIVACIYGLLLILGFARLMTLFWLQPLTVERELSADVLAIGEKLRVVVKLTNPSPWPILWLYAEETLPEKMPRDGITKRLLFLPPGRSFFLTYQLTPLNRGCHQIGPMVVESGDVFGLFRKSRIDRHRDFVTVVPSYEPIGEFQVGQRRSLGDITAMRSVFEDTTRIRGIREYQRGDPLKRIHWKSSARLGTLHSKIYDPVVEAGATVILDFHADAWSEARALQIAKPAPEIAIELACTVCRYLSDGGWRLGFFSNGRDPLGLPGISMAQARAADSLREALTSARLGRPDDRLEPVSIRARRSPDQFHLIHECLGRLTLSDGLPLDEVLLGELPHIEREQALVVITGAVGDGLVSSLLRARALGYRIMVFVVCNPAAHDRAFEALLPGGIEVFQMDQEWRMREIATGRRSL